MLPFITKCFMSFVDTKLAQLCWTGLSEKNSDLFEKNYRFISLGRKPNFFVKALEKELRLS